MAPRLHVDIESGSRMAPERPPDAFLSYTRFDDQNDGGAISEFCKRLANAVRSQTGKPFEIFQDVDGIGLGERWRGKLDQVLDEARFFIPIVTPSYFTSKACRAEFEKFLRAEAARGRDDLVLPIYYIESESLEDEDLRAADPLARVIHERQRQDWRDLRFEPFDAKEVRRELVRLAIKIVRARRREMPPASAVPADPIPTPRAQPAPTVVPPPRSAEPDDLAVIRDGDFAPELVVLPRGEFMMGSPDGDAQSFDDEKPQHRVKIDYRLAVGRYPVTFEEWDRCAEDEAWHRARHVEPYKPSDQGWGRGKRPVINVSWEDIQGYLRWLSGKTGHRYRLLSEAEWEYACRAGTTTAYSVGPTITQYDANFDSKVGRTVEVGSYTPNDWGLYDMHGNVWEWVEDCWNDSYVGEGRPDDGRAWTSGDCGRRVLRGGSWEDGPEFLRSAIRSRFSTVDRDDGFGFRVARTLSRSESVTP
jgi:formylglycine-generating enzyme required for sulfatase activity